MVGRSSSRKTTGLVALVSLFNSYVLVNEKNKTVHDLWDGQNLRCTYRRILGNTLFRQWEEVIRLASTITFTDNPDEMVWRFTSNGTYSSQSLYKIVNFRGIRPVYLPAVWSLEIPPKINFFIWLLSQNKVLTKDNVAKRKHVEDSSCLFCTENGRWRSVTDVLQRIVSLLQNWEILCPKSHQQKWEMKLSRLRS